MTIQTINLGTAPSGAGGDTFRSTGAKINENFTNPSHAASRYVGTATGNVMEVGAFGWGRKFNDGLVAKSKAYLDNMDNWRSGLDCYADSSLPGRYGNVIRLGFGTFEANRWLHDLFITTEGDLYLRHSTNSNVFGDSVAYLSKRNTTVDSNGFIKAASPIIHLYADKIQLNHEASEQEIIFEKLDVGHYLIKGSSGFAQEGWYVETPKDANGNILFAVQYHQFENYDIEVKTFKKKFDIETASIVADLENPVDITLNRWIDIRLQEVPKPVREMPTEEVNSDEPQQ
ncbi:borealin N-terminal domain-containing protein [Acinetobacter baumannii]